MGIEIERKFLVRGNSWRAAVTRSERFCQAYLGGDRCSVRIRIEGHEARLNIKSRSLGIERLEFEYAVPMADAESMLAQLAGQPIDKVRHFIPIDDVLFEVDEFAGDNAGLIVAEVELPFADAPYPKPDWLGREVSGERRYFNAALVETPFSTWPDRHELLKESSPC